MSTESDAAAPRVPTTPRPALWRLLGYARPYVWPIAAAILIAGGSSAGQYWLAYQIKPFIEDVLTPAQALRQAGAALPFALDELVPGGSRADAPLPQDGDALRARLSQVGSRLGQLTGLILALLLGTALFDFAHDYVVAWVLGRIDLDMKIEVCGKLLALPLRFHRDRGRGDLLARIMGDVGTAQGAL
ncbi:MAG TPA: ABC transporter transmembrane domain-containing protein, partial [Myxococcota bacterium]|nr:ABC transporter transmembrane domain-containing protein [Myxococcota bacterium]